MRGRKPRDFSLAAHDVPILQQIARSRTLPWFQVQRARAVLALAGGERVQAVAFQMPCDPSTVWRICRRYEQSGLEGLLSDAPRSGHPVEISPPCSAPKSCNWRVWSRSLRGCISPIGLARIWPARRSPKALYRSSVPAVCGVSCGRLTCSHIARAIGKLRASSNARRRFSGVTPTPDACYAAASGSSASTRCLISKPLSASLSAGRFPALLNSRSSSTYAMARSMYCCF